MGIKKNNPGCQCCKPCIWATATSASHQKFKLIRSGEVVPDFDWSFADGDILQTDSQSPFIRQGQILVDVTFDLPVSSDLTFDTGTKTTGKILRIYFESDEARNNYVFLDIRLRKLEWNVFPGSKGDVSLATRPASDPGPESVAFVLEIGRRTSGTDVVINRNSTYITANHSSPLSQRLVIALSRHECDFSDGEPSLKDAGGFCFDGYSGTLHVRVSEQLGGVQNLALLLPSGQRLDRLTAFHPVRTSINSSGVDFSQKNVIGGLDPGVGFGETLTEPVGTYAGIEYHAASPVDANVAYVAVGKYEKGFKGTRDGQSIGATEVRYAAPVSSISGPGSAYIDTGSFETQVTLGDAFYGETIYGRLIYNSGSSPSASFVYSSSPSFPGGGTASNIFKVGTPPATNGTYDFEFKLTPYEGMFHGCMVWPIPYKSPCSETGLIVCAPTVINSGGTSSFAPLASDPGADQNSSPGPIAFLGNFIASFGVEGGGGISGGTMSQIFVNGTETIPVFVPSFPGEPPPPNTYTRSVIDYDVTAYAYLAKTADYLQPAKVFWYGDEQTRLMETYSGSGQPPLTWDYANKLFVPKQPGSAGHLLVWVEVFENARVQQGFGDSFDDPTIFFSDIGQRNRYYGLFAAIPVTGDSLDCNGLTIEVLETSKKAFYENSGGSTGELSSLNLEKVVLNFDAI